MKMLIPIESLSSYGARQLIPFACEVCSHTFYRTKNLVCRAIKGTKTISTCSRQCSSAKHRSPQVIKTCKCGKEFESKETDNRKTCSQHCANIGRVMSPEGRKKLSETNTGKVYLHRRKIPQNQTCQQCGCSFERGHNPRKYCSPKCRNQVNSERCKTIPGMCKNNNRHAGWYESPIAGRVWLESTWEVTCAEIFDKHGIPWTRPKPFPWLDAEGKWHKYYPDFFLPDYDLYLDPKNPYAQVRDAYKIEDVKSRHGIKLLVLNKIDLKEETLLAIIKG